MALLAKKTIENNELMKQIVATITNRSYHSNNTINARVLYRNNGASTNNTLDNSAMMAGK